MKVDGKILKILFLAVFCIAVSSFTVYALELTSPVFKDGEYIPHEYTGEGPDLSPELAWKGVPKGTKSFALICDDPDAPVGNWVHWVVYNIPADVKSLDRAVPELEVFEESGMKQGLNDFQNIGYGGPMPPRGNPHRYFFKLYALDVVLELDPGLMKEALLKAMEGHVLEETMLMGMYKRWEER
ncbi:MAG: YbhB/YbcL family Raf kinase inhibitor-like protein [PVC group bacterium]|nr:YbhB/YbcL family Raf kinase inhibitor-like protein [PVC group bacterium]